VGYGVMNLILIAALCGYLGHGNKRVAPVYNDSLKNIKRGPRSEWGIQLQIFSPSLRFIKSMGRTRARTPEWRQMIQYVKSFHNSGKTRTFILTRKQQTPKKSDILSKSHVNGDW
jgi:hypothetical protein